MARSARFAALAMPFSRRRTTAASMSPFVSCSARLQSIIPVPVRSRSSRTSWAEISAAIYCLLFPSGRVAEGGFRRCLGLGALPAPLPQPLGTPLSASVAGSGSSPAGASSATVSAPGPLGRRGGLPAARGLRLLGRRRLELLRRDLVLAGLDRVGERADDEVARADRVVVARDDVVGLVGIAVRVDERDDRNAEPARLVARRAPPSSGRRSRPRRAAAACRRRRRGSPRASRARFAIEMRSFAGRRSIWPSSRRRRISWSRSIRSAIVCQFVSRPPSQRWLTYGMPVRFASLSTPSCACFFVPTKRTVPPRSATLRRNCCASSSRSEVWVRSMM